MTVEEKVERVAEVQEECGLGPALEGFIEHPIPVDSRLVIESGVQGMGVRDVGEGDGLTP
jgi:hypothetical protein